VATPNLSFNADPLRQAALTRTLGRITTAVTPTALFLDLDGVLRIWPKDYLVLESEYNLPPGSLASAAFEPSLLQQVITGRLSDKQWRSEVGTRLSAAFPSSRAREAVGAWSAPTGSVNGEVLHLAIQARQVCRIGLITNATDRLPQDLADLGLTEHFDLVVNSSAVGFAKPRPEIFRHALHLASVESVQAAFVDDTLTNVLAARALGIRAHHFTSIGGLLEFMHATGLPANAA
jgi:FMN phosphatase YigB (HAD superfamily)